MRIGIAAAGAALCWMAGASAAAQEARTEPSREAIARQIAAAESGKGAGVTGIVIGALAIVGGVASLWGEAEDEHDRDEKGYGCTSSGCTDDLDEEPEATGFIVGFVAGAGLIALGTVGVVKNNRRLRRLHERRRQLRVGYDVGTGAATVAWNF